MTPIAFQTDLDAQNRTIGSDVNRNGMPVVTDAVVPTRVDPLATTVKIMRGKDKLEPAPPTPPEQPIAIAPLEQPIAIASPQKVGVPSATDTIKEMLDSRRSAIYHAAMRSSGGNPDADAKTLQAARDSGTSYDFVLQNMEQTQRRLFGREVAKLDLPKNAPVLAEKLATDPDFARVANDDLANLKEQEGWWSWLGHQVTGIPTAFMHGFAGYEHAESGAMQVFGPSPLHPTMWSMADPQTFENRNAQLNAQELTFDPENEGGWLPVFNMFGQTAYQFARAVPAAGGGAIVGGLTGGLVGVSPLPWQKAATPVTTLVGAQLGAKAGLSAALIDDQVRQGAGMMYNRMIDEGVDPNVARWKAASWGLALGGIQVGLMKVLYPKIATSILETQASKAAADRLLAKKLAAAIADPSMKGVVKRISAQTAQTTAKILGSVGGTVIMFEAGNEDARRASNLPMRSASPEGRAELIDIAVNNFKFMATGAVGLHVLMPSAHNPIMELGRERSRIRAAEKQAEGFETLSILQKASKLAVRSPEDAQSLMEGTLTGTPIEDILISKEGIQRAMATLEIPMAKLDEVIPGALAQFNDVASGTAESGGYIKVKTADFKARIEKTPLGSLLLGDVTWSAEIGTMRESAARSAFLKTFISEINENVEKFADEVNEAISKDDEHRESAEKVANVIEAQMLKSGRSPEEARAGGRLLGAAAFVGAERESKGKATRMTPEEFHRKYPLHIAEPESEKPSEPAREVAAPTETAAQVKPVVPTTVDPTSRPRTVAEMLVENRRAEEAKANEPVGQMSRQGNDAVVEAIANLREANEAHKGFAKDEGSTAKTASMHEMMSDQIAAVEREVKAGDAVGLEIEIAILQEMLRAGNIREARNAVKQPGIAKQLATAAQRLIDTARDELDRIESTPKTGEEGTLNQPLRVALPTAAGMLVNPTDLVLPTISAALPKDTQTAIVQKRVAAAFSNNVEVFDKKEVDVKGEKVPTYGSIIVTGTTPEERAQSIVNQMARNLLSLYSLIPERIRARTILWYDGANTISRSWTERYRVSADTLGAWDKFKTLEPHHVAGVIAVYSPQMAWQTNLSLAERTLDILAFRRNFLWSEKMSAWADEYAKTEDSKFVDALEKIRGVALKDVDAKDYWAQAIWVRAFDEAHHDKGHRDVSPEGRVLDMLKTAKNADASVHWGPFSTIAKAIRIATEQSIDSVHEGIGNAHKVRSFYNNIVEPNHELPFFTSDTHQVAANLLLPVAGNDIEVAHNFGAGGSSSNSVTGLQGTYFLHVEAGARAADLVGIMPRQMQSATWEVIRAIFSDTFKSNKANKELVRGLWAKYISGETSYEQTFTSIVRAAGGYQEPSWAKHGSDYGVATQEREGSTYRADVPRPQRFDIPKQQPRDGVLVGANVPRPDRQREFSPERFERRIKANEGNRGSQRDDAIRFARHQSATSIVDEHGYSQRDRRADDVGTGLLEGVKIKAVYEAGSGLVKAFELGGMKAPSFFEIDATGADQFAQAISNSKAATKFGAAVLVYPVEEYRNMRLFMSQDGKSGFALKPDGDIVSVFSSGDAKAGMAALQLAIKLGGSKLDAFDTALPKMYAPHGFKVVARLKWDEQQAPIGWDKKTFSEFNNGEPDVVFMALDANSFDSYRTGEGEYAKNYEDALQKQDKSLGLTVDQDANVSKQESGVLEQAAPASPEFFSALKRSVDAVDAKELTGAQWKDRIATLVNKGEVKEEEIYWTGFYDFLDMQREGKITKEELAAFLQNNGVKVEEIRLANITSDQMGIDDRAMSMFGRRYDDLTVVQMAEVRDVQEKSGVKSPPQYEVLTLPNGTNYREVLLTLPAFSPPVKPVKAETLAARTEIFERYEPALKEINEKIQANVRHSNDMTAREMDAHLLEHHNLKIERHRLESARDQEARQFPIPEPSKPLQWIIQHFGSHGRNNNVLASVRLNDRVSQQGERVLHDEENQSDYAAKGRKRGFEAKERMEKLSGNMLERELLRRESELRQRSIASSFAAYRALDAIDNMGFDDGNRSAPLNLLQEESNWTFENGGLDLRGLTEDQVSDLRQHVANLQQQRNLYTAQDKNESLVRRAPFVTSTDGWVNLSIKHMLMEAVKGDYKYLSFITGDQSVDRYKEGLVEETSKVQIRKNEDGTYNFYASLIDESKSDKSESHVSADRIQELFGEQGAKKLVGAADAEPSKAVILEENIPIGGAGMRKFYDSMLIDAVNKISKKLGGGKVELLTMSDGTVQPALEITDAMAAKINEAGGLPLFQAASKKPARASFNPKTFEVKLGHHSDMTSWVHESSHYLFETYHRMILDGSAPKWVADDFQTLLTFFGVKDNAEWNTLSFEQRRKHYEKFSYNFEIYMAEGKAPTIALQPLFDRFKSWIIQVYTDVVKHQNTLYKEQFGEELPPLTDEVRRVMDRMLATEEQIRSTAEARDMKAMFQTQEEAGVSDAAWAEYQTVLGASHRDAVNELTARSMRDFQWVGNMKSKFLKELAKKNAATRRAVRDEVEEQVRAEPIFRAIDFLKYGMTTSENGERVSAENVGKLNLADAKAVLGDEAAKLGYGKYGMIAKDGMPADLVAELFGFKSGDELLRALAAAKKVGDEIDARTDERMMKEFGDLNDPERMEQAANAALHNDARARAVATELNFITKALTPVKEMVAAAREAAVDHINNRKIKDVKAHEFAVAEAKAARAARSTADSKVNPEAIGKSAGTRAYNKAIANGVDEAAAVKLGEDAATTAAANAQERINLHKKQYGDVDPMESARRAKQHQLFNNQLAAVAGEVQEEVRDTVRGFSKFFKADSKIGKSRDIEMVMAARSILSAFGFGRSDKAPIEYVKQIEAFNPELFAALEPIIARASRGAQDYREMTVAEFRALSDGVTALWNDARRDKQIMVGEKKVALAQVVGELVDRTNELGVPTEMAGDKSAPTRRQRMMRTLNGVKNMMRRVEHWCDAMDGLDNTGGPFTKYIFRPIVDAMDAYRADRTKYLKRYAELCATIELPKGRIAAPELDYTFGVGNGGIGKSELLGALLHMGNDGNMRKLLIGRKWGELDAEGNLDASRMMKFINRMVTEGKLVKADFDFVQSVWDLNEELKPMAQKSHRDLYGFYFKEVEATPLNTPFGTYRGGYVPAKPDPFMVKDAQRNAKMDALEGNFNQVMPSTGLGFTKSRVEYNRPLALDLRMIGKHIDDVIRFAHVQPAIKDVLKVIGNEEFSSALSKIDPTAIETMLVPFLGRAARHTAVEQGRFKAVDDFWIAVRGRTSLMFMSLNLRQLGDVGGISVALTKVKSGQLAAAMKQYLDSPHEVATMIGELSPMMDERLNNHINDTRARLDDLIGNQSGLGKAQALARKHGMFLNTVLHNQLDIVTWLGAYNQALAEIAASAGDKEAQREAVSRADAAVRLTQGAMNPEDVAAYEQGTPFYRTITQFTTYLNTLANLNADEYGKIVRELGIRKGAGKLVQAHILAYAVPMIIFGVWTDLISGGWDDDDESWAAHALSVLFGSYFSGGIGMLPFGSQVQGVAEATIAKSIGGSVIRNKEHINVSPSINALEGGVVGAADSAYRAVSGKEITGKNIKDALTLVSLFTGIPLNPIGKTVGYAVDVNNNKIQPTGTADYIRGLITGSASPESKK